MKKRGQNAEVIQWQMKFDQAGFRGVVNVSNEPDKNSVINWLAPKSSNEPHHLSDKVKRTDVKPMWNCIPDQLPVSLLWQVFVSLSFMGQGKHTGIHQVREYYR